MIKPEQKLFDTFNNIVPASELYECVQSECHKYLQYCRFDSGFIIVQNREASIIIAKKLTSLGKYIVKIYTSRKRYDNMKLLRVIYK